MDELLERRRVLTEDRLELERIMQETDKQKRKQLQAAQAARLKELLEKRKKQPNGTAAAPTEDPR